MCHSSHLYSLKVLSASSRWRVSGRGEVSDNPRFEGNSLTASGKTPHVQNPLAAERGPCHSSAMKFSRLLQLALCLASLFPRGLPLSGQLLRVGTSDNIPIGKLETMNDALQ